MKHSKKLDMWMWSKSEGVIQYNKSDDITFIDRTLQTSIL